MNASRGGVMAFGVLGLGLLAVGGITASKMGKPVEQSGEYDMAPIQVKEFILSAAVRKGWTTGKGGVRSSLRKVGEEQLEYSTPLLPWMTGQVTVRFWPEKKGTHVELSGDKDQVNSLKSDLDNRLPALSTP